MRAKVYVEFARPFTLVAPALGFISGALTAVGAHPRQEWSLAVITPGLIGAAMAAIFNAGSNALNQIYDLEIDGEMQADVALSAELRQRDFPFTCILSFVPA